MGSTDYADSQSPPAPYGSMNASTPAQSTQPAGAPQDRTTAVVKCMQLLTRFRAQTFAGAWHASLDRQKVADRLIKLVDNPDLVNQGANGLCGEAAFFNVWLWGDPFAVARFGVQLYNSGGAAVGISRSVMPGRGLRGQDFGKIADGMRQKGFGQAGDWGAEWMMMSSLRDATNWVISYDGTPSDTWGGGTTDREMAKWLEATGLFKDVSRSGSGVEHDFAAAAKVIPGNDAVILSIDSHLLGNPAPKSPEDDHDIVLKSAIIEVTPGIVDFRYWSWGEPVQWVNERRKTVGQPELPKSQFTAEFFSYVIGKR